MDAAKRGRDLVHHLTRAHDGGAPSGVISDRPPTFDIVVDVGPVLKRTRACDQFVPIPIAYGEDLSA